MTHFTAHLAIRKPGKTKLLGKAQIMEKKISNVALNTTIMTAYSLTIFSNKHHS